MVLREIQEGAQEEGLRFFFLGWRFRREVREGERGQERGLRKGAWEEEGKGKERGEGGGEEGRERGQEIGVHYVSGPIYNLTQKKTEKCKNIRQTNSKNDMN